MDLKSKTALITGATSGIGKATATMLAEKGIGRLILAGRRTERLEELSRELNKKHQTKVHTITLDVRCRDKVKEAIDALPDEYKQIDILLNNAGLASGLDPIDTADIDDFERMIDTNVKGLLYVTKSVIPLMEKAGNGHIINLCSIAGKEVYGCGNVYCASKHAVDALTRSMRIDLIGKNIKVSQIAPGAVLTEFSDVRFHGDSERAKHVYDGYAPLTAEDIAECLCFMIMAPEHVNIADMLILPKAQADGRIFNRTNK